MVKNMQDFWTPYTKLPGCVLSGGDDCWVCNLYGRSES